VEASKRHGRDPVIAQANTRNTKGRIDLWTDLVSQLKPTVFPIFKSGSSVAPGEISTSLDSLVSASHA